jgi:tetratricopeptide (TPR) repeat protein
MNRASTKDMKRFSGRPGSPFAGVIGLLCLCGVASAADTVFLGSGVTRFGDVVGMDESSLKVRLRLAPRPDGREAPTATISVPRRDVVQVEFAEDTARDDLLRAPEAKALPQVEAFWKQWEPFLAFAKSPAGMAACAYGEVLVESGQRSKAQEALELFARVEKEAWDELSRMRARQGRLRAMVAVGNAAGAVKEAGELAKVTEDPAVLIQAKYILANAADAKLRELVAENPRWEEDIYVIPERHRLYNEALDEYLFPYLFFGSESGPAARGLAGAMGIYRFTGETGFAIECARDLIALYPETQHAKAAKEFVDSLPAKVLAGDPEKESRESLSPSKKQKK